MAKKIDRDFVIVDTVSGFAFEGNKIIEEKGGDIYYRIGEDKDKFDLKDNANFLKIDKTELISNGRLETYLKQGKNEALFDAVASKIMFPDSEDEISLSKVYKTDYKDEDCKIGEKYSEIMLDMRELDYKLKDRFAKNEVNPDIVNKKLRTNEAVEARQQGLIRIWQKYDIGHDVQVYKEFSDGKTYKEAQDSVNENERVSRSMSELAKTELQIDNIKGEMETYEKRRHLGTTARGLGLVGMSAIAIPLISMAFPQVAVVGGLMWLTKGVIDVFRGLFKTYESKLEKNYYKELKQELKEKENLAKNLEKQGDKLNIAGEDAEKIEAKEPVEDNPTSEVQNENQNENSEEKAEEKSEDKEEKKEPLDDKDKKIEALEKENQELKKENQDLKGKIKELEDKVDKLQDRVDKLEKDESDDEKEEDSKSEEDDEETEKDAEVDSEGKTEAERDKTKAFEMFGDDSEDAKNESSLEEESSDEESDLESNQNEDFTETDLDNQEDLYDENFNVDEFLNELTEEEVLENTANEEDTLESNSEENTEEPETKEENLDAKAEIEEEKQDNVEIKTNSISDIEERNKTSKINGRNEYFGARLNEYANDKNIGLAEIKSCENRILELEVRDGNVLEQENCEPRIIEFSSSKDNTRIDTISSNGVEIQFSKDVLLSKTQEFEGSSISDIIGKSAMSKNDQEILEITYETPEGAIEVYNKDKDDIPEELEVKIKDIIGDEAYKELMFDRTENQEPEDNAENLQDNSENNSFENNEEMSEEMPDDLENDNDFNQMELNDDYQNDDSDSSDFDSFE